MQSDSFTHNVYCWSPLHLWAHGGKLLLNGFISLSPFDGSGDLETVHVEKSMMAEVRLDKLEAHLKGFFMGLHKHTMCISVTLV